MASAAGGGAALAEEWRSGAGRAPDAVDARDDDYWTTVPPLALQSSAEALTQPLPLQSF